MVAYCLHVEPELVFAMAPEALLATLEQTAEKKRRHNDADNNPIDGADYFVEASSALTKKALSDVSLFIVVGESVLRPILLSD